MKTLRITFSFFLALFVASIAYAQNFISVNGDPASNANFTNLQTAIDSAQNGDVIYVYPIGVSYGNISINKQVAIFGKGFNLGSNLEPYTQATLGEVQLGIVTFQNGSSGSILQGVTVNSSIAFQTVSNIEISHSKLKSYCYTSSGYNSSSISIIQNYITYGSLISSGNASGWVIKSNIFDLTSGYPSFTNSSSSGTLFANNVVYCTASTASYTIYNATVENCIFITEASMGSFSLNGTSIMRYSIASNAGLISACASCTTALASDLFVGFPISGTYSDDAKFLYKTTSPALGFAQNGDDIGPFGPNSYRLSGIPDVPNIYYLDVPSSGSSLGGLNIHIKAKAND